MSLGQFNKTGLIENNHVASDDDRGIGSGNIEDGKSLHDLLHCVCTPGGEEIMNAEIKRWSSQSLNVCINKNINETLNRL